MVAGMNENTIRDPRSDKLRRALVREFEKYLDNGGDATTILAMCGYFLEQILDEMPEPARSKAAQIVHRRICKNERDLELRELPDGNFVFAPASKQKH